MFIFEIYLSEENFFKNFFKKLKFNLKKMKKISSTVLLPVSLVLLLGSYGKVNAALKPSLSVKSSTASSIVLTTTSKSLRKKKVDVVIRREGGDDDYTKLLIHADGSNGSTSFHDECKNPVSGRTIASPGLTVSTSQYKFGTGSAYFPGSGNYFALNDNEDWNFSGGLWTFDAWIRVSDLSGERTIFSQRTDADNNMKGAVSTNGSLIFVVKKNGSVVINLASNAGAIVPNNWYHVAFVENNDNYNIYLNGTLASSTNSSTRMDNYTGYFVIGYNDVGNTNPFSGYMDEIRVSKGVARWTDTSFTSPSIAYGYTDKTFQFKRKKTNAQGKVDLELTDLLPNTQYTFYAKIRKTGLKKYSSYSKKTTGSTSK